MLMVLSRAYFISVNLTTETVKVCQVPLIICTAYIDKVAISISIPFVICYVGDGIDVYSLL